MAGCIKKLLLTDSYHQASALMINITPHIPFVKSLATPTPMFDAFISNLIVSECRTVTLQLLSNLPLAVSPKIGEPSAQVEPENALTLSDAWTMYKAEKGGNWTKSISMANQRYIEVLLVVLGENTDVTAITKQDIRQVMEVVENLPKRIVQPYRSMKVRQLIDCDEVPLMSLWASRLSISI